MPGIEPALRAATPLDTPRERVSTAVSAAAGNEWMRSAMRPDNWVDYTACARWLMHFSVRLSRAPPPATLSQCLLHAAAPVSLVPARRYPRIRH